jgi:DNA replication protein DnaC
MKELMKKLELSEIGVRKRIDKIKEELIITDVEIGAYCLAFRNKINITKKKYNIDKEIIAEVQSALRSKSLSTISESTGRTKSISHSSRNTSQKRTTPKKTSSSEKYFEKNDAKKALAMIKKSDTIQLSNYKIIGNYVRYDEEIINNLKDLKQKIIQCINPKTKKEGNFLIWGSPGTGKTYLINQIADSQKDTIQYYEFNLAELTEKEFKEKINEMEKAKKNCICLIDEIDSDSKAKWVYEFLMPHLLPISKRTFKICFILAGSGGGSIDKMKEKIKSKNKGIDCLNRIPDDNHYTIPTPNVGDRFLAISSQLLNKSKEGFEINKIDKLALFYILVTPKYFSLRQIEQLVTSAVLRVPLGEDRMSYDALFDYGDLVNKEFWLYSKKYDSKLLNSFIHIKKN